MKNCWSYNFHTFLQNELNRIFLSILLLFWYRNWYLFIKKKEKLVWKKMLIIQFPYMEMVWLAFFKFFFVKKKLWTINSTAGKTFKRFLECFNWKLRLFLFLFSEKKTLVIQFPYMKIAWLAFFEKKTKFEKKRIQKFQIVDR